MMFSIPLNTTLTETFHLGYILLGHYLAYLVSCISSLSYNEGKSCPIYSIVSTPCQILTTAVAYTTASCLPLVKSSQPQ